MTLAILLGLAGLACALAAAGLARGNRLSTGHGVAWFLIGLLLLAGGLGLRLCAAMRSAAAPAVVVTGLAIALLVIVGLAHASSLTRLEERVKRLAQEVALLRDALADDAGASQRTGDDETPPGRGRGAD